MEVMERIKQQVEGNSIVLYMKGSPQFPMCGFSGHVVQALQTCDAEFQHVDILSDPEIRANLPNYANWPTFPQLYINGELVGGCDIVMELYQRGELQKMIQAACGNSAVG